MKTFNVTHADIVDFGNLLEADRNASQYKHYRDENLKFSAHREEGIIDLLNQLTYFPKDGEPGAELESSYHVGRYRRKQIRMRKSTRKRMFRRIKFIKHLFEAGHITFEKVNNTMQSYFGLIQHFTAGNLLRKIIDEFSFRIRNNS